LITGDLAKQDENGYFYYIGREDDIIKSSGYRIGPTEIEECINRSHSSVSICAVVGSPDPVRNEIVKAFIVLKDEYKLKSREEIKVEIQNFVKTRLAFYEYPREIEFVDSLPMTSTGKIMRKVLKEMEKNKKNFN
jgi:acetyl-CoA synthetase